MSNNKDETKIAVTKEQAAENFLNKYKLPVTYRLEKELNTEAISDVHNLTVGQFMSILQRYYKSSNRSVFSNICRDMQNLINEGCLTEDSPLGTVLRVSYKDTFFNIGRYNITRTFNYDYKACEENNKKEADEDDEDNEESSKFLLSKEKYKELILEAPVVLCIKRKFVVKKDIPNFIKHNFERSLVSTGKYLSEEEIQEFCNYLRNTPVEDLIEEVEDVKDINGKSIF